MTSFAQPVFLAVVFIAFAVAAYVVLHAFTPTAADKRVQALAGERAEIAQPAAGRGIAKAFVAFLARIAGPSLPEGAALANSPMRVRFYNAGLRQPSAPYVYFGLKTLLTFLLPGLMIVTLGLTRASFQAVPLVVMLLLLAAIGYFLPNVALAQIVRHRQRELFESFPDALDLMRVCVEAGLGLDAAIDRVGREMELESPALSDEFHLVSLELRAGASRADALRNLALRVALEDVDSLVSMLVQADRFGTSIADSLRIHADTLRTKRRLIAEEAAAKLPVKLLVPLIFCVFPALLTVLLGPAAISVYRMLLPRLAGQ